MIRFPRNKMESDEMIRSIGVNYTPFEIVNSYEEAERVIDSIPAPIGIREKRAGGGKFLFGLDRSDVLRSISTKEVSLPVGIYQDMSDVESKMIYQGEIWLFEDGSLKATYNCTPGIKNREACSSHPGKVCVNIDMSNPYNDQDRFGWDYYPLRDIIDYCLTYRLIGCVVEFSYYSVPVGWKKENINIWEIRNY
jgi:hypothetical protein